ncbi:MAG: XrtA system polysaccharide chain length determinant [Thermodesulfobacteriota bacterium]
MINPNKPFNIHDYIEVSLRRIWYVIIPLIVVMIGAILYAHTSPKLYRATTLILITPQKVPEAFVRPTVTSTIVERLQSIGQEIMSRTRLEQVISDLKLYQEEAKSMTLEGIVELMRKNIQVEIKGKEGYFTISYIGKDPKTVTLVTNKLASLFIEENLKLREQQAQGTSEFLFNELEATKAKLEEQEKMVAHFKKQFMGELPEQRDANLRILEQLQLQYQRAGDNLRAAQDRRLFLQKQLSDFEALDASEGRGTGISSQTSRDRISPEVQLEQFKNQLSDLQTRYTERHPDILIVRKRIAELEAEIEKTKGGKEKTAKESERRYSGDPRYKETKDRLMLTEREIERLKEEEANIRAQMAKYSQRVEKTFSRELEIANLTRDYENTKEVYQSLLKKSQEAQQAENLERRQKGEQFKVIDPARTPERPFKPDIQKIFLFGLLLGLGSGLGLAFFREQMDRSFRDAEDLEATFGIKVIGNIPKIEKKAA